MSKSTSKNVYNLLITNLKMDNVPIHISLSRDDNAATALLKAISYQRLASSVLLVNARDTDFTFTFEQFKIPNHYLRTCPTNHSLSKVNSALYQAFRNSSTHFEDITSGLTKVFIDNLHHIIDHSVSINELHSLRDVVCSFISCNKVMINKSYNREMIKAKLNNWGVVDSRIAFLNESSGTENLSITLLNQEEIKTFSLELANLYYDAQTNPDVYKLKARLIKDVINNLDMLITTYLFDNNFNATLLGDMHNVILKFIEANKEQIKQSDFKGATQYVEEQLQTFKQDLENGPQLRESIAPLEESRNTVRNTLEELSNEYAEQNKLYKYCNSMIQVTIDSINMNNTSLRAERLIDRDMDLGILRSKSDAAHSKMKEINTLIEEYRGGDRERIQTS